MPGSMRGLPIEIKYSRHEPVIMDRDPLLYRVDGGFCMETNANQQKQLMDYI